MPKFRPGCPLRTKKASGKSPESAILLIRSFGKDGEMNVHCISQTGWKSAEGRTTNGINRLTAFHYVTCSASTILSANTIDRARRRSTLPNSTKLVARSSAPLRG